MFNQGVIMANLLNVLCYRVFHQGTARTRFRLPFQLGSFLIGMAVLAAATPGLAAKCPSVHRVICETIAAQQALPDEATAEPTAAYSALIERGGDYISVTVTRDGAFGVGTGGSFAASMSQAIRACRATSQEPPLDDAPPNTSNCGAQLEIARGRWMTAALCGDQPLISMADDLATAQQELIYAEIALEAATGARLQPCKPVVTVNPQGAVVRPAARSPASPHVAR
jgi:hypothetical protein